MMGDMKNPSEPASLHILGSLAASRGGCLAGDVPSQTAIEG